MSRNSNENWKKLFREKTSRIIPKNLEKVTRIFFNQRRKKIKKVEQIKFQDHIVQEWQTFIRRLPRNLSQTKMREIDRYLRFSFSGNSELLTEWFILSANCGYASTNKAQITAFLNKVGRRKYLMPIYEALLLNKQSRPLAISIFQQSKDHYHAVSRKSVEALIKETK